MEANAILAKLLRDIRIEAGMTQAECAQALGRTQSYISNIESGQRRLDPLELRDHCRVCGISLTAFVERFEAACRVPRAYDSIGDAIG